MFYPLDSDSWEEECYQPIKQLVSSMEIALSRLFLAQEQELGYDLN